MHTGKMYVRTVGTLTKESRGFRSNSTIFVLFLTVCHKIEETPPHCSFTEPFVLSSSAPRCGPTSHNQPQ